METKKLKKSVQIRLQKQQLQELKEANEGMLGDTKASLRNVPTSPRKMRLIADLVRGKHVADALNILRFHPKAASKVVERLLKTAIADWQAKNTQLSIEDGLYIAEIYVDGGRMLKRLRPAPQGRGYRVRKRSNHLTMVLSNAI